MRAAIVIPTDVADEVRTLDAEVGAVIVIGTIARSITTQGKDVADAEPGVVVKDLIDVFALMIDAGEVRDGIE